MDKRSKPLAERLATKYERGAPDACWLWTGARWGLHAAYGTIYNQGHKVAAHRAMWITTHDEPIPDGYEVCHTCDNPLCVNPAHLWLGTHQDNMQDRNAKGRGGTRPYRKLTEAQVREIRALRGTVSQRELARRYGVSQPAINLVLKGISYANR